ncbi:MAG: FAD-dependent oxidoreductase [Pseudomonadota bacterium]
MTDTEEKTALRGRIEGGFDAVVIGANADGLAAAAYLGKAGLKTALIEPSSHIGGAVRRRALSSGHEVIDGEHLLSNLDADVVSELGLYRFGLSYAARCIETQYRFSDGRLLDRAGDWRRAVQKLQDRTQTAALETFVRDGFEAASRLRPVFAAPPRGALEPASARALKALKGAPRDVAQRLQYFMLASTDDVMARYGLDDDLRAALFAETHLYGADGPSEPFSFLALMRRWSGDSAGLQGALSFPKGGAVAVIESLRNAALAAKVDIRTSLTVDSIIIERDTVAGVEFADGGQIRAPIVISALGASRTYLGLVGAHALDIDFQTLLGQAPAKTASAQMHLLLKNVERDDAAKKLFAKRIVGALSPEQLKAAFAAARAGAVPEDLIIEAVFPDVLNDASQKYNLELMSVMAHPLPLIGSGDESRRLEMAQAILSAVKKRLPEFSFSDDGGDLVLSSDLAAAIGEHADVFASRPSVLSQHARAGALSAGAGVAGLYFCGPEAQIGAGISCLAARTAAKSALRDLRRGRRAA